MIFGKPFYCSFDKSELKSNLELVYVSDGCGSESSRFYTECFE